MKFRLGIVGHKDTIENVTKIVHEYFDNVTVLSEEFGNDEIIEYAVKRIAKLQTMCDGILYSRRDPYLIISDRLHHTIPVRYVDIDSSHLLISLLKANIEYGCEPKNISIDTLDRTTVVDAFKSVGIPEEKLTIHMVHVATSQHGMVNDALAQHLENYRQGAILCITNITDVYHSLKSQNIPVTIINPTTELFVHEIRNLMLRYRLTSRDKSTLALINIKLRYKEKYRFYCEMPIREINEISTASKLMTMFAEKLDGALFALSRWEYVILCSCILLEQATDQLVKIGIMEDIYHDTAFDISIGIGCGQTVKEAQSNSILATNKIMSRRGSNTVVVISPEKIIGPIAPKSEHFEDDGLTETHIQEIAEATGLSTNTINKLYQATHRRNTNLFTSIELADILEVTTRTVNRTIERLSDHNYAAVAGKNLSKPKGRPARVIKLLF